MKNLIPLQRGFFSIVSALVFFVLLAGQARAVVPTPYTEAVTFSAEVTGVGNCIMSFYGENTATVSATTYNTTTETGLGMVYLRPGKTYHIDFSYSGPSFYALGFSAPTGYVLYINGEAADLVSKETGGGESHVPDTYTVELRPVASLTRADAGTFSGVSVGKSISWDVALGGLRTGRSAGRIFFKEPDLVSNPMDRSRLYYTAPANDGQIDVIMDGTSGNQLRQVVTPQVIVDLVDGTGGYWLNFYQPSQATNSAGVRTFSGSPWKNIWVDTSTTNQLTITETEGSVVRVSQLALTSGSVSSGAYVWTLQEGGPSGAWARTTTNTSTNVTGAREELVEVRTGGTSGTLVASTKYRYEVQGSGSDQWGEEVVQATTDPFGAALTTAYTYYTSSASPGNYRKVHTTTGPTGNWAGYTYYDDWNRRGQLYQQYSPWIDAPATATTSGTSGRVVTQDYGIDWTGRYRNLISTVEQVNGQNTGKTTAAFDNTWGPGEPLWEKSWTYNYSSSSNYESTYTMVMRGDAPPDEVGLTKLVLNPNKSKIAWTHARGDWSGGTFTQNSSGAFWREVMITGSNDSSIGDSSNAYDGQFINTLYLISGRATAVVTIHDAAGNAVHTENRIYTGSATWQTMNYADMTYDGEGHLTQQIADNGALSTSTFTDGRLVSSISVSGTETQVTYDGLGRIATMIKKGATALGSYLAQGDITTTYTYDGAGRVIQAITSGGALTLTTSSAYDLSGRVTSMTAPGSYMTSLTYSSGGKIATATLAGGATKIAETYLDGRTKQLSGTGQVSAYWVYDIDSGTGDRFAQSVFGGNFSAWTNHYADWLGRETQQWKAGWNGGNATAVIKTYNDSGQVAKVEQPGVAPTLYTYDTMGHLEFSGQDLNNTGSLDIGGDDRMIAYAWHYFYDYSDSGWAYETWEQVFPTSGSSLGYLVHKKQQRVTNFVSGRLAQTKDYDQFNNLTLSYVAVDRTNKKVTAVTQVPTSSTTAQQITYNGLAVESNDVAGVDTFYQYDDLGRMIKSIDPRTGMAETTYVTGTNQIAWVKDTAANAQATYAYDSAGRVVSVRDVYGRYTYSAYNDRGQVLQEWGETVQPVSYTYNALGQRVTLSTYRGGTSWTGATWPSSPGTADTTTWTYDASTNMLNQKTDASGASVNFTYTSAGQVATRQWARGVTTTYAYSGATGELTGISYSDGTPSVGYTYNRLGQIASATDVFDGTTVQTRTFEYNANWQLATEKLPAYLGSRWLNYQYQDGTSGTVTGRSGGYTVGVSGSLAQDQSNLFGYDTYGRVGSIAAAHAGLSSRSFTYGYVANSDLLSGVSESTTGYNVARTYETNRDLLTSVTTQFGTTIKTGFNYTYDVQGLRATALQQGGSTTAFADLGSDTYYRYAYNARGELTGATGYMGSTVTATTAPMPGRAYGYAYDNAGNRLSADSSGVAGLQNEYTLNNLNQITSRENNYVPVSGTLDASAAILVNGGVAGRQGKYWSGEAVLNNIAGPVYTTIPLLAAKSGSPALKRTTSVSAFIAKALETYTYDADGNLTQDGRWTYTYDGENQLISMQASSAALATTATGKRLDFRYDSEGRRISKRVYTWSAGTSTWVPDTTTATAGERRFVYQGWNLAAELDNAGNLMRSYAWGLDIAGSTVATGGIGALVQIVDHTSGSAVAYLPGYDAQGNVAALMKSDGTIAAAYEYSPFGETIRKEGVYAMINSFRNSTKYTDEETGLVYYGMRYYNPSTGRWINRDRAEESGGINLYGFASNDGINGWDYLGMDWTTTQPYVVKSTTGFETIFGVLTATRTTQYTETATLSDWDGGTTGGKLLSSTPGANDPTGGLKVSQPDGPGTVTFTDQGGHSVTQHQTPTLIVVGPNPPVVGPNPPVVGPNPPVTTTLVNHTATYSSLDSLNVYGNSQSKDSAAGFGSNDGESALAYLNVFAPERVATADSMAAEDRHTPIGWLDQTLFGLSNEQKQFFANQAVIQNIQNANEVVFSVTNPSASRDIVQMRMLTQIMQFETATYAGGLFSLPGGTKTITLHRPYIRNWVRAEVEAAAQKAPDGRFIDPNTGMPTDNPVLGHKPGYEFWRLRDAAQAEGVSQKLFNETLNNPEFYQIEDRASNASHIHEQK